MLRLQFNKNSPSWCPDQHIRVPPADIFVRQEAHGTTRKLGLILKTTLVCLFLKIIPDSCSTLPSLSVDTKAQLCFLFVSSRPQSSLARFLHLVKEAKHYTTTCPLRNRLSEHKQYVRSQDLSG